MDNQPAPVNPNQIESTPPASGSVGNGGMLPAAPAPAGQDGTSGVTLAEAGNTSAAAPATVAPESSPKTGLPSWIKWGILGLAILAVAGTIGAVLLSRQHNQANSGAGSLANIGSTNVDLSGVKVGGSGVTGQQVDVNGLLKINNQAILTPSTRPANPVKGQIYLDSTTNLVYYFDGTTWQTLGAGVLPQSVASIQGQSGAVILAGGGGITINGTTISNTGVVSLQGLAGALSLATPDAAELSVNGSTISLGAASSTIRGLASFNGANLSVSDGNVNTVQDINTGATPTFAALKAASLDTASPGALTLGGSNATSLALNQDTIVASDKSFKANGDALFKDNTDNPAAFQIQNSAGSDVLIVDTLNNGGQVGIGYSPTMGKLDVNGNINIGAVGTSFALKIGGVTVCDSSGCGSGGGATGAIKNQTVLQPNANFNVQTGSTNLVTARIEALGGQTADLFQIQDSSNATLFSIAAGGQATLTALASAGGAPVAVCRNASNQLSNCDANTTGTAFLQGGNSFGALGVLGTNDNNSLAFRTNGTNRATLDTSGNLTFAAASILSTTTGNLTLQGGSGTVSLGTSTGLTAAGALSVTSGGSGALTLQSASGTVSLGTSTGLTAAGALSITSGGAAGLTLQSASGTVSLGLSNILSSTGALTVQSGGSGALTIDTGGAAALTLGGTNATSVAVGRSGQTTTINGTVVVPTLGTNNTSTYICRNASNQLAACSNTGAGTAFLQGGNSFGADGLLGTNDSFNLQVETHAVVRATFDQNNNLYLGNGITAATPNNFVIQGTGSSTAGTAGATLTVAGGAGATTSTGSAGGNLALNGGNAGGSGVNNGGNVLIGGGSATSTGTPGQVIIKNAANSSGAFQVQNASSAQLFNVDTQNTVITLAGNHTAELQPWASTTALCSSCTVAGAGVATNGAYVYAVGGTRGGAASSVVSYAPLNANGTVGTWGTTRPLGCQVSDPSNCTGSGNERTYSTVMIYNGVIYVIGGADAGGVVKQTIYFAKISANGTIASWQTADNKMNVGRAGGAATISNGYLYIIGGGTGFSSGAPTTPVSGGNSVEYAKINPDTSTLNGLSAFTTAANTGAPALLGGAAISANGNLYYAGGQDPGGTAKRDVYHIQVNSDGSIGSGTTNSDGTVTNGTGIWTFQANLLNTARTYVGVRILNGYLYAIGGGSGGTPNSNTYEYGAINSNGNIGTMTQSTSTLFTNAQIYSGMIEVNGYLYIIDGNGTGGVQYASGPRVIIGGSLDLVDLSGQSLGSGGIGGTLTAGNTTVSGTLRVLGTTMLGGNVAVQGDFATYGNVSFRPFADSTNAATFQSAAGQDLLELNTVDSSSQGGTIGAFQPGVGSAASAVSRTKNDFTYRANPTATINTKSFSAAYMGDGLPSILNVASSGGLNWLVVSHCIRVDCSGTSIQVDSTAVVNPATGSALTNVGSNAAGIATGGTNNGLPVIAFKDSNDSHLVIWNCSRYDCTGSNTFSDIGGPGGIGQALGITIGSNNMPLIVVNKSAGGQAVVVACTNHNGSNPDTCAGTPTVTTFPAPPHSISNDQIALNPVTKNPVVVAQEGTGSIYVAACSAVDCSGTPTVNELTLGGHTLTNPIVMVGSDGKPVVASDDTTSNQIVVMKCQNSTCSSYTTNQLAPGVTYPAVSSSNLQIGAVLGTVDQNPVIAYKQNALTNLIIVHCGNLSCNPNATGSSANIVTSISGNSGGGGGGQQPNIVIDNANNPNVAFYDGQVSSNNQIGYLRCIENTCSQSSGTAVGGGISLGNGAAGLSYANIAVTQINAGVASAHIYVDSGGKFSSNALSSDANGNVAVNSASATALAVTDALSTATIFNVDASADSVNIGTATSQSGRGLNVATSAIFQNATNSTSALAIQDASSLSLFNADTTNAVVSIGSQGPLQSALAAGSNQSGTFSGVAGTTYFYKVTAITPGGESPASNEQSFASTSFAGLTPPTAPSASNFNSGNVSCDAINGCTYKVTFVTSNGETTGGAPSSPALTNLTSRNILLGIPTGPASTTARKIYRSTNGGPYLLDQTVSDNITTGVIDNVASPAGLIPGANTARTNTNSITVTFGAVSGATSYRIYRGTSSGGESAYQTTASSPFTDANGAGTSATPPSSRKLGVNTNNPGANLDVEGNALFRFDSSTALQVQNASGSNTIFAVDTSGSQITLGNTSNSNKITLNTITTGNGTITFPAETGTVCTTNATGVCATAGSGYVQFAPASAQTDGSTNSSININKTGASGNLLTLAKGGNSVLRVGNGGDLTINDTSASAFRIQNAGGTSTVLTADTSGLNLAVNANTTITSANSGSVVLTVQGSASPLQAADLIEVKTGGGATAFKVNQDGSSTFQPAVDSTTAFLVKTAGLSGTNLLVVDTTDHNVGIGLNPNINVALDVAGAARVNGQATIGNAGNLPTVAALEVANTFSSSTSCGFGCYGVRSIATANNPASPTSLASLYGEADTGANVSSYTLQNAYGLFVASGTAGAGSTITNNYGAYIANQTKGSSSNIGLDIQGGATDALLVESGRSELRGDVLVSHDSSSAFIVKNSSIATFSVDTSDGLVTIQGNSGQTTDMFQALDSSNNILDEIDASGNLTVQALTLHGHIVTGNSSGSTTVAAGNIATCTDGSHGTPTISGNDTSGTVTFTINNTATCGAGGTIATVSFAHNYIGSGANLRVVLTPANGDSSILQYFNGSITTSGSDGSGFTIDTNTAPTINKTYKYNYLVVQ